MIVYPVDFDRRARQKWARRLQSLRMPVARANARLADALAGRIAHRPRGSRNRPTPPPSSSAAA